MARYIQYHVLTLPLTVQPWQDHILQKRFAVAEEIYNAILGKAQKRYQQMRQTKAYREIQDKLKSAREPQIRTLLYHELDSMVKQYGLGKFELSRDAAPYRQYFKQNMDSPVVQNLALSAWKALETLIFRNGNQISYKRPGQLSVLSGKTNQTSIRYQDGCVIWKKLRLAVGKKKSGFTKYEREALKDHICYCRLKRQIRKGGWKYFVQIVLEGNAPSKMPEGFVKPGSIGMAFVGKQLVVSSGIQVEKFPLFNGGENYRSQIDRIDAYLERSKRACNPKNYQENGKVRTGKREWIYSNRYYEAKQKRRELFGKLSDTRYQYYCILAKQILQMGNRVYVEEIPLARLKKRQKENFGHPKNGLFSGEMDDRGYGKEISQTAPGIFLDILEKN